MKLLGKQRSGLNIVRSNVGEQQWTGIKDANAFGCETKRKGEIEETMWDIRWERAGVRLTGWDQRALSLNELLLNRDPRYGSDG